MLQPIRRALSFSSAKVFHSKMGVIALLVVVCCIVFLCGALPAEAQESFENGFPPSGWTFNGLPALGGVADISSGIGPTDGTFFGWISTGCVFAAGTSCPDVATASTPSYASLGLGTGSGLGSPQTESVLISPSFTLPSSTLISFDVNFITTDGTNGFADFALVQLIPSTGSPVNLFVANTTGDTSPAVPPVILNPADAAATLSPSTVSFLGTSVTFGATTYGNIPKFGGSDANCAPTSSGPNSACPGGPTGWVHVTYTAAPGTYTLRFLVSHVGDTNYPSALAIDNIMGPSFVTTPVVTDGTTPTTVVFNPTAGQLVEHSLLFPSDVTSPISNPQLKATNRLISNSTGWPPYVNGTPFAPSLLFVHAGDVATNGSTDTDTGSLYVDECFNSTNAPSEPNCPFPNTGSFIFSHDIFDVAPPKPTIATGTTVSFIHYYPNTILSINAWSPSSMSPNPVCTDLNAATFKCDLHDIVVSISGDQTSVGGRDGRKGSFAAVFNVPMLETQVKFNGLNANTPGVQSMTPVLLPASGFTIDFAVSPAATVLGNPNNFMPAPINSLTFAINQNPQPPMSSSNTDTPCPGPSCTAVTGTPGATPALPVDFQFNQTALPAGTYFLHWSAIDNVGIFEKNAQLLTSPTATFPTCPNPDNLSPAPTFPCYATALFTQQINLFTFSGFLQPVDNPPAVNTVKGGSGVPVKFSLGGNFGLNIFQPGFPASIMAACASGPLDAIETTMTAGQSSLSFDPVSLQYTYVWKTLKSWSGTCRQLQLKFADGTTEFANFKFN